MNMNKLAEQEKKNCKERKADPTPDEMCLEGLAILQADKAIPAKVLNRVFVTAKEAGYDNLLFAVNRKGSSE
jgi:hypothetical protein